MPILAFEAPKEGEHLKINRRVGTDAFLIDVWYLRISMLRLKEGEPGALNIAHVGLQERLRDSGFNQKRLKAQDRMLHRHSKISELK